MPGSNTYCRVTAKLFTEFAYYSPVYASPQAGLEDEKYLDLSFNVSGDDNTIYGLVTHPITTVNEVYDGTSDATGLKAALYRYTTIQQLDEDGNVASINTWMPVGEKIDLTAGTPFKFEHLFAAIYKLVVTGTAENYAVNVSYQYEPMKAVMLNEVKYTNPQRYYAEPNYTIQSNSINNIGNFNTTAVDSVSGNLVDFAPNV